jgi:hypothetical protein
LREEDARKNKDIVRRAYTCTLAKSAYDRGWFHFLARNLLIFSSYSRHPKNAKEEWKSAFWEKRRSLQEGRWQPEKETLRKENPGAVRVVFFLPNPYVIFGIVVIQLVIFQKSKDIRVIGNFS